METALDTVSARSEWELESRRIILVAGLVLCIGWLLLFFPGKHLSFSCGSHFHLSHWSKQAFSACRKCACLYELEKSNFHVSSIPQLDWKSKTLEMFKDGTYFKSYLLAFFHIYWKKIKDNWSQGFLCRSQYCLTWNKLDSAAPCPFIKKKEMWFISVYDHSW